VLVVHRGVDVAEIKYMGEKRHHIIITPNRNIGVNFINVLRTNFSYEPRFSSYVLALNKLLYKKFARLTLMKLTAGRKISLYIKAKRQFFFSTSYLIFVFELFFQDNSVIAKSFVIAF